MGRVIALVLACVVASVIANSPMTINVDAGAGKDSVVALGSIGRKVSMHAKDNKFSITANGNEVLKMTPLSKDAAAFTPEIIGSFEINSIVAGAIYSEDFEIVNPDAPLQQWLMVHNDEFTNGTLGWSAESGPELETSECGGVTILGGPCKTSHHVIEKTYELPTHAQVQITARFHFIDNWDDDQAFLQASTDSGLQTVWTEEYSWCSQFFTMMCPKTKSVCGKEEYPDKISRLLTVSMPHTSPTLTLKFGTNIPAEVPPCMVSYGVSSVVVEVR